MRQLETSHTVRRKLIQRLLSEEPVATQEELRQRLAKEGVVATQTTLSRDLARLGARRTARPGGGTLYALDGLPASQQATLDLRELILGTVHNESLVVVRTRPGAASAIARAIDEARLPEMLATLAGDDTIFIAPASRVTTRQLAKALNTLFGRDD